MTPISPASVRLFLLFYIFEPRKRITCFINFSVTERKWHFVGNPGSKWLARLNAANRLPQLGEIEKKNEVI